MAIKICKYRAYNYNTSRFVEVRFTLLGFIFRNQWSIIPSDFEKSNNKWIPCYMGLWQLIANRFR